MDNRDSFGSRRNLDVISAVTEGRPKPCFTITAVIETKNTASFGAVTETEFRLVSSPDKLYVLCPNLRIRGHLPAPIINGGGDSLWKWPNFRLSRARDLDLDHGSGHTTYRHASLIDLCLHTKFHWNRINVLSTDGRADGHLRHTSLGRLAGAHLIMYNKVETN